jgi:DNA-binding response OmpR family regulator
LKIAVLDEDRELSALLCLWLEADGNQCQIFESGEDFLRQHRVTDFDVILLDWMLPGVDGESVLDQLRKNGKTEVPVIFITSRTMEEDMVHILDAGADDYLTKPLRQQELLARIRAVTRRAQQRLMAPTTLEIGPYYFNPANRSLTLNGEDIKLTDKEYELAYYLFSNLGRLVSRDQILSMVWGYENDLNTRTVDTHISRIRKKLRLMPETGWRLNSIYHRGYRLEQPEAAPAQPPDAANNGR